ncbi:hypothetical protein Tco_1185299 [Tanacetum coccineum]
MRNIKMTMSRMQLNSKFVNNMLPEWSKFITEVKLNRGLKESNFDQLYAYLKQHEVHANENRMMMESSGNVEVKRVGNINPGQLNPLCATTAKEIGHNTGEGAVVVSLQENMSPIFDQRYVDQNVVDKQCAEIVKKNLLIENENLIANIGRICYCTCPKEFTERDSKAPSIPLTRKKQVTFTDTCGVAFPLCASGSKPKAIQAQ